MSTTNTAVPSLDSVALLDHTSIQWNQVRSARFWIHQRFCYEYPGPIRNLHQRLIVVPPDQHGHQHLLDYQVRADAPSATASYETDMFGNRVFHFAIPRIGKDLEFDVWSNIEHKPRPSDAIQLTAHEVQRYRQPTALTTCDERMAKVARELYEQSSDLAEFAERVNDWTYGTMEYLWGITHVGTTAPQALTLGRGVCQDYSHIMLALCRYAGLPARYVSGHFLGEGGSHAWVEVLVPNSDGRTYQAVAYDPTNHCRVGLSYLTVAVGRDYRDVAPISGSYAAPYQGHLTVSKRAGVTNVEYT